MIGVVYAPTDDSKIELKESFFDQLANVIQKIGKNKESLLMGYFNGGVGMEKDNNIICQFGEDIVNDKEWLLSS